MLERIKKDGTRAGDVIGRIRALARKAPIKVSHSTSTRQSAR